MSGRGITDEHVTQEQPITQWANEHFLYNATTPELI